MNHRAPLLLLLALWPSLILQAGTSMTPAVDPGSGVRVEIESWLEYCPQLGMVPLKVRIHNGTGGAHAWTIETGPGYESKGIRHEMKVAVDAGRSVVTTFYAPVTPPQDGRYHYGNLQVSVTGHGITSSQAGGLGGTSGYRGGRTEYIGMGKRLSAKGWSALRDRVGSGTSSGSSSSQELSGSELDMGEAPEDWRGYSGLGQLWLESSEWLDLREVCRAAVLDWVATGGKLYVVTTAARAADLEAHFGQFSTDRPGFHRHGAGHVETVFWEGRDFPLEEVYRRVRPGNGNTLEMSFEGYNDDSRWPVRQRAGELTMRSGLVFGFIVIFGLLVGPVNLFWFAGSGRRYRLFWTTPILSLAGSSLLIGLMVLQDGTGGSGARMVLATTLPESRRLAVMQEQVCRTGVLLGRRFPVADAGWMVPLSLEDMSRFGWRRSYRDQGRYRESPQARWGDWFLSRSIQGHYLQTVRSSRSAIEFFPPDAAGGGAAVLSSLETPLLKVFIVDESGGCWFAEDLGTGEKKTLARTTRRDFSAWLKERGLSEAGPVIREALDRLALNRGHAFAEAADSSKLAIPTLASIRWKSDRVLVAGPYVKR